MPRHPSRTLGKFEARRSQISDHSDTSPRLPEHPRPSSATRTQPVRSRKYKAPIVDDGVDSEDDDSDGNYEPEETTNPYQISPIDDENGDEDYEEEDWGDKDREYDNEVEDVNIEDLLDSNQEFIIEAQDGDDIAEVDEEIRQFERLPSVLPSKSGLESNLEDDNFSVLDNDEGLFHGNTMSAEQYRKAIKELDEDDYKRTEYGKSTTERIDYAERQWRW